MCIRDRRAPPPAVPLLAGVGRQDAARRAVGPGERLRPGEDMPRARWHRLGRDCRGLRLHRGPARR
eukprot:2609015-Alexandrium_andersonii.AAC.1